MICQKLRGWLLRCAEWVIWLAELDIRRHRVDAGGVKYVHFCMKNGANFGELLYKYIH